MLPGKLKGPQKENMLKEIEPWAALQNALKFSSATHGTETEASD